MTGVAIRRLAPDDWAAFRSIRLEALRTEPANFASDYETTKERTEDQWRTTLTDLAIFGAYRSGDLIGIAGLIREAGGKMAHRASIVMVYVRPPNRGQGIASRLMGMVSEHAAVNGIWQIELTVSAENHSAYQAYVRQGFVEFGRLPGGYILEGRLIDDILMMRRLREPGIT